MCDLLPLVRRFLDVYNGEENTRRRNMMNAVDHGEKTERIPAYFSVPFDWSIIRVNLWKELLQRDIEIPAVLAATGDYPAAIAESVIEFQLLQRIFYIEQMPGDRPISNDITTNFNLLWLNGDAAINPIWTDIHRDIATGDFHLAPFIHTVSDMEKYILHPFHFDHALHERRLALFQEMTDGMISIHDDLEGRGYLNQIGSPFQELCRMHGTLDTLMDMRLDPPAIHAMMADLTDKSIERCDEMNAALGKNEYSPVIGGDEINCDMFSPDDYDEFILPYETKCAGLGHELYYHSCGNLTPIFDRIAGLPNIHRIHVSPWSDLVRAASVVGEKIVLQKIVDTQKDIMQRNDDDMRMLLGFIRTAFANSVAEVACHCETFADFELSKRFIETAHEVLVRETAVRHKDKAF